MYDPTVGRFLEEDPIGPKSGDMNFYRYCGNSPMNETDPTGTQEQNSGPVQPAVSVVHIQICGVRVGPGGIGGHSFILVPDGHGGYTFWRAGPSPGNTLVVDSGPYVPGSVDWPKPTDKSPTRSVDYPVTFPGGVAGVNAVLGRVQSVVNNGAFPYKPEADQLFREPPQKGGATCNSFTCWVITLLINRRPRLPLLLQNTIEGFPRPSWGGCQVPLPTDLNPGNKVY